MASTEAIKEALSLKGIIKEFGIDQEEIVVLCDSQSALHLVKHQTYHERTRHIDVKFHFCHRCCGARCCECVKDFYLE